MMVAIYARSADVVGIIAQIQECKKYIVENWGSETQITIFTEIVKDIETLENCKELQKLCNMWDSFNVIVVYQAQHFFPQNLEEYAAVFKKIGSNRKIHYVSFS